MEIKIKSLHRAAQKNDLEQFVKTLKECESYFDPSCVSKPDFFTNLCRNSHTGDTVLHVAAQHGHIDILRVSIEEKRAPVDIKNHDRKTPLHEAAQFSQLECAKYLLAKDADVNAVKKADWTPLMLACTRQNVDVVVELLKCGADPFFTNKDGWNSFHIASREGNLDIIKTLVNSVSDPNLDTLKALCDSKSKNGRKPCHTAALHGHTEVVRYIWEKKLTSPDQEDNCGTTALMDACRSGVIELIDLLISNGADKNLRNKSGFNCLHVAAEAGVASAVRHLVLRYGFDVSTPISNGTMTAMDIAKKEGQNHIVELLTKLDGNVTNALEF